MYIKTSGGEGNFSERRINVVLFRESIITTRPLYLTHFPLYKQKLHVVCTSSLKTSLSKTDANIIFRCNFIYKNVFRRNSSSLSSGKHGHHSTATRSLAVRACLLSLYFFIRRRLLLLQSTAMHKSLLCCEKLSS